jgi:hypothetical protein
MSLFSTDIDADGIENYKKKSLVSNEGILI